VKENGSVAGTAWWARIQRPAATCQLVSPSMKTRCENAAMASSVIAAAPATARSSAARRRVAAARRGLNGWVAMIGEAPRT
jgi:hypothetical protein